MAGLVLDLIGFLPGAKPGPVDADVVFRLGLFVGPIAAIPGIAGALVYARYAITRQCHRKSGGSSAKERGVTESRGRDLSSNIH